MISEDSIKQISQIFCGDIEGYYSYKSGPKLVGFFNRYFHADDRYQSGFPSRWAYVYDKIAGLINTQSVDAFFNIILSREYLIQDSAITEVKAAEKATEIKNEFNRIIGQDLCKIVQINDRYHLVREKDDLVLIGSGGFANVFRQKSTGLVVKKIKDDFLSDAGIRSRFKREFSITKSLQDSFGIIKVYSFGYFA